MRLHKQACHIHILHCRLGIEFEKHAELVQLDTHGIQWNLSPLYSASLDGSFANRRPFKWKAALPQVAFGQLQRLWACRRIGERITVSARPCPCRPNPITAWGYFWASRGEAIGGHWCKVPCRMGTLHWLARTVSQDDVAVRENYRHLPFGILSCSHPAYIPSELLQCAFTDGCAAGG